MDTPEDSKEEQKECPELQRLGSFLQEAEGLVFDVDGTLVDSMPLYYETWKRSCNEVGLELTEKRFYSLAGVPVRGIFQTLIDEQLSQHQEADRPTPDYCMEVKKKHMHILEEEGHYAGPVDVVIEIAKQYHGKVPMACASSGWRDHVLSNLKRNGILHLFDHVVTNCDEEVLNPKPAPDIFLVAAQRIGVSPHKCVGFEDGDPGMNAIQSANFLYASDVRTMHRYPRNVEERQKEEAKD
jgi:beta-phosphoglucomutase-like phosphatase (HAD superfamily)